jgi:DNA-binding MarR family transcriptional regulator
VTKNEEATRPDALWKDAWRGVLFAASRTLRVAEPHLVASAGFPLTWLDVLSRLSDAGTDGLRMQELEETSLFTRSGLTRLVDRIEAAGLVRREPVPGDRRGVRVVLTEEGRRRHDAAGPQPHRSRASLGFKRILDECSFATFSGRACKSRSGKNLSRGNRL